MRGDCLLGVKLQGDVTVLIGTSHGWERVGVVTGTSWQERKLMESGLTNSLLWVVLCYLHIVCLSTLCTLILETVRGTFFLSESTVKLGA